MNGCWKNMYDEFFGIPLMETNVGGWKELTLTLSITLEDGTTVDGINCWIYRDDMITMLDGELYKLPSFKEYKFV